jgi:putative endonuclease
MYAAYVYILRCADGSYYVGSARGSLDRRLEEHAAGINCRYTKSRRPVTLVWSQAFQQITDAIAAERQIKGWTRAKKEAFIRGDFEALRVLAQNRSDHPRPSTGSG